MDGRNVEDLRKLVLSQAQLINTELCRNLVDAYVLEFFTENHWKKLPKSWQSALTDLQPPEIADQLLRDHIPAASKSSIRNVLPLSLLALKSCCHTLSLPRKQTSIADLCKWYIGDSYCDKKLSHDCRKHVKVKKQVQIQEFAEVISCQAKYLKCTNAVDIGAGLGHLSRHLSLSHELRTVGIEAEGHHGTQADVYHKEAAQSISKKSRPAMCKPQSITYEITPDTSPEDLLKVVAGKMDLPVSSSTRDNQSDDHECGRFLLVGLHPCGDLSSTMLRMFVETPEIRGFACVLCCYMQLTQRQTDTTEISHPRGHKRTKDKIFEAGAKASTLGYPMSQFVQSLDNHLLGFNACELACHSLEQYFDKLKGNNPEYLRCHCYRAVLEFFIKQKKPDLCRYGVRINKKKRPLNTFTSYLHQAMKRLDVPYEPEYDYDTEYQSLLEQWTRVVVFYTLRLLLAPVVESLLLCDRLLYLAEAGVDACVVPLFDPVQSPRNLGILAQKEDKCNSMS